MAKALKATLLLLALALFAAIPAVASAKTENSGVTSRITAQQGPPSVSISAGANAQVRLNSPVPVTATFSEPVSGFTLDDISVVNGTAGNFSGGDGNSVYTFSVTPDSLGEVTVDIAAGVATDSGGAGNAAAPRLSLGIPYDFDGNGGISKNEAIAAVVDYFAGSITKAQTIAVIVLYFSSPAEPEPEPGPSDDCIQTVTSDGMLDGQWGSGCDSEDRSGSHARYYRFTLDASSEVTVTLGSSAANTYLYLRRGDATSGTALYENDDHQGSTSISQIQETLAAGAYTIEATTYEAGETGGFSLTISGLGESAVPPTTPDPDPDPANPCVEPVLAAAIGQWSAECNSTRREGAYARYYTFALETEMEVTIDLESGDVDTYLYLLEGTGTEGIVLNENDDVEPDDTDSRLQEELPAGSYTIEATTLGPGETGSFTLTVAFAVPAPKPQEIPSPRDFPWVQDGLASDENSALYYLEVLHRDYPAIAQFVLNYPWVADSITEDERRVLAQIWNMTGVDSEITASIVRMQFLGNPITNLTVNTVSSMRSLVRYHGDRYDDLAAQPWFQDDLTDEEQALVIVLPTVSLSKELFLGLVQDGQVDTRIFTSPLRGEMKLFAISRSEVDPEGELLEALGIGVEKIEGFINVPWPTRESIVLLEPELRSIWGSSLYGVHAGTHIAVRHTGSFLLYHELTHYLFKGSPSWFSEGSAHFLADYVLHLTDARSLRLGYIYTQDDIVRACAPLGAANIQEWIELGSGESQNPARGCQYNLGELFFLGMYNRLGNQVVSSSLSGLYETQVSKGSYALTEDEIYQQFLANTPLEKQDDFRRLYHCLHGRLVPGYTPAVTNSPDRAALVALYNATNGSNWRNNTNWLSKEAIDQWYGISTDCLGRVIRLNLNRNQLAGSIPAQIGALTNLVQMNLSGNQLAGSIPAQIGALTNLVQMNLSGNQLAGSIPAQIGALTNLLQMNLSGNQLRGHMPKELGKLTNLERLILQFNQLSGPIPVELGRLVKLDGLHLDGNQLSGPIPRELGNLSRLEFLLLHVNQLSGPIPRELGKLVNLEELYLYGNQLSGSIPKELGRLDRLEYLLLAGNQLSGPIPVELTDLTRLKTLMLSSNRLSGPIPKELGGLANLESLLLYNNQLSGPIPEGLRLLASLRLLLLDRNQLSGPIPEELGSLANLERLNFNNNRLTGPMPTALASLTALERLDVSHNMLTGPIPASLGSLTNLEELWLHYNQLSGPIPEELGNLVNLKYLGLVRNPLTGCIPRPLQARLDLRYSLLGDFRFC